MTVLSPLNLLQQKMNYWAEMALLINNEFAQAPEGFGFVVKGDELICSFIEDYDLDRGDELTPPGEMPVFAYTVLRFSVRTTAEEVYRHIQQAVDSADQQERCRQVCSF